MKHYILKWIPRQWLDRIVYFINDHLWWRYDQEQETQRLQRETEAK